ncbi:MULTISPECIES: ABC transporter permease [Clostridium]|uniref:ABC transporter permease n=1 Tax=Clostridium cibarium TaxID=2762247 RepID=A0ABR8PWL2_9CLOT|nr:MULTISPECIES: ABC transporter permease [Clostridium]MBD7912540.1 ABC transporter permease [Clostridium cibarium]
MIQYIIKRVLKMIPIMFILSIIFFVIVNLTPGDFVDTKANPNMSAEKVQELKEIYGFDKPVPVRYINWAKKAILMDFGDSLKYKEPVSKVLGDYVWNSFYLAFVSFILCLIISIPIGIISAVKQYSKFDKTFTILTFIGISLPSFFIALVSINIFSLKLGILPVAGMSTAGTNYTGMAKFMDLLKHMFLPVATLTILNIGNYIRYVRTSMLEVIRQDYIRTARAKGLKEKVVIYKHALRNGLIPIITYIGLTIPSLFAGAIITETIFVWPGIGKVGYDAIVNRDYTLVMGFNMFMGILTLIGNLLSDVLYAVVDPRIRLK